MRGPLDTSEAAVALACTRGHTGLHAARPRLGAHAVFARLRHQEAGHPPEAEFLEKLKKIDGVSQVETQTMTNQVL